MNSSLEQEIRSKRPLNVLVVPQLCVLALFLACNYGALVLAWAGNASIWGFFVDAVTVGIGWPLLSVVTLMCSLVFREEHAAATIKSLVEQGFLRYKASELESEFNAHTVRLRRVTHAAWVLGALSLSVVIGSIVGAALALLDAGARSEFDTSLSALLTVVGWFVFICLRIDWCESFGSLLQSASNSWGRAQTLNEALQKAKVEGRVDTALAAERLAQHEAWLKEALAKDARTAAAAQALVNTPSPAPIPDATTQAA